MTLDNKKIISAEPFRGVVNIRYRGAVIASSDDTLIATREDDETLHLVPTKDVNFELLAKSARVSDSPALSYWDVVAVGERLEAAVVVFETAVEGQRDFSAHAAFRPGDLDIDAVSAEEKAERVEEWPS